MVFKAENDGSRRPALNARQDMMIIIRRILFWISYTLIEVDRTWSFNEAEIGVAPFESQ